MKKLILLAFLLIMLHAASADVLQPVITQSVSPPSPQYFGENVEFSCRYTWMDQPIPYADVYVTIDGAAFKAEYSPTTENYTFSNASILPGTHVWYCNTVVHPKHELLGGYDNELRMEDGHFDSVNMTEKLIEGNMHFYNYLIGHTVDDWNDLPGFLEETKDKNISVIVDLIPEWGWPPASEPFKNDFIRWGTELANLSLKYPHLIGYSIDDWGWDGAKLSSLSTITYNGIPAGVDSGRDAARAVNPNFKFYPTTYFDCDGGVDSGYPVDGVLLYPEQVQSCSNFPNVDAWKYGISSCKSLFPNDTIVGIYASADDPCDATPEILKEKVLLSYNESPAGVMTYCLQWNGELWGNTTALYRQWDSYYQPQAGASENYEVEPIQTTLMQTAAPASPQPSGATVNFTAIYADGVPISGATVKFYLDGMQIPIDPLAALKASPNGYLYVPNASKIDPTNHTTISYLKIEKWCNMSDTSCQTTGNPPKTLCGCARMVGDRTGGTSPYATITEWPDTKVRVDDSLLEATCYGKNEGQLNFSYMADVNLDRKCRVDDVLAVAQSFGQSGGSYSTDLTDIMVIFNNKGGFSLPDANGYVQIPSGAVSFTVYNGSKPVMALVTFWRNYTYITNNLSVGSHTWYFTASKQGYQSQTGPTQYYAVTSGGAQSRRVAAEIPPTPALQWQVAVSAMLLLGVAILVYISLRYIARKSVGKRKRK
jgi:hypothetical protein